jgi:hypothetical protein
VSITASGAVNVRTTQWSYQLPVLCSSVNEIWSVALREEHGLRLFENRVLRRIFGPKRVELTGA